MGKTSLQYRELYSECPSVFFGDNGQGDLLCGEDLAQRALDSANHKVKVKGPMPELPCVSAVFIHEVIPREQQLTSLERSCSSCESEEDPWRSMNVYFHKTYLGAAVNAFHCQLIAAEGLSRVGFAAVEDLLRMRIDCCMLNHSWELPVAELNADVEAANALLPNELQIPQVPRVAGASCLDSLIAHSESLNSIPFTQRPLVTPR